MKFFIIKTGIVSVILMTVSSFASAQSNQPSPQILPTGVYYALGTYFNRSYREIVHQNNRICIKIVDGPPNPYKGVQSITISSVSVQEGKFYIDATGRELVLQNNGTAFSDVSHRLGLWEYRSTSLDPRRPVIDPRGEAIQAQKMAECVEAQGRYVRKMKGLSISGIDFPKH
jgi:hypothetical protein